MTGKYGGTMAEMLRQIVDHSKYPNADTWYVEARVGADNFRGECVRFIDDRRQQEEGPLYENRAVEQYIAELLADRKVLLGLLSVLALPRRCSDGQCRWCEMYQADPGSGGHMYHRDWCPDLALDVLR